jgi:hypothetical protein
MSALYRISHSSPENQQRFLQIYLPIYKLRTFKTRSTTENQLFSEDSKVPTEYRKISMGLCTTDPQDVDPHKEKKPI